MKNDLFSAKRRTLISAGAFVALALSFNSAHATTVFLNSVGVDAVTPSDTDNDFLRLKNAIAGLTNDQTLFLNGTFDLTEDNARAEMYRWDAVNNRFANANSRLGTSGANGNVWYVGFLPTSGLSNAVINGQGTTTIIAPATHTSEAIEGTFNAYTNFLAFGHNTGFGNRNVTNLTVTGIEFSYFQTVVQFVAGNQTGFTFSNNTVNLGMTNVGANGIVFRGTGNGTNIAITNNTFNMAANTFNPDTEVGYQSSAIVSNAGSSTKLAGLSITGNEFLPFMAPTALGFSASFHPASRIAFFDNANVVGPTNWRKQTFANNVVDGTLEDPNNPGEFVRGIAYGVIQTSASNPANFTDPIPGHDYSAIPGIMTITGNTFTSINSALYHFTWGAADFNQGHFSLFYGNTIDNVGATVPGGVITAITNALGGTYGSQIPKLVYFDLDTTINGRTGIEMLNYLATENRTFFSSIANASFNPDTDDAWEAVVDYGVTAAFVRPEADPGDIVNNPAWTDPVKFPRFFDPLGNGDLAKGYNAFGDAIDPGDPNRLLGLGNDVLIEITEREDFAPGTRIGATQTVTIRGIDAGKAVGGSDPVPVGPTTGSFAQPLFILDGPGSTLVLDNVVLTGDAPGGGDADMITPFGAPSGGDIQITQSIIENFLGEALFANNASFEISAQDVLIRNVDIAIAVNNGGQVHVDRGLITNVGSAARFSGNTSGGSLTSSIIGATSGATFLMINGPGNFAIGGAAENGNLFLAPVTWTHNGFSGVPSGNENAGLNISFNTHVNVVGPDTNNDGFIDGTVEVPYVGSGIYRPQVPAITNGKRFYGASQSNDIVETNIVAVLDRDGDGLPDFIERRIGTNPFSFDSSNNGVPDGAMFAAGLNPNSTDIPAGWVAGSLTADTNNSGIADWYEAALTEAIGAVINLGDLDNNGAVSLGDAITALRIVNGAASPSSPANPHAINVTGGNPLSLGNPLQILRFQATVRSTFPAVPGIN